MFIISTNFIAYDLGSPSQDCDKFIKGIKGYGAWWHLDSMWSVQSVKDVTEIRGGLRDLVDGVDEILAAEVAGACRAWVGVGESGSAWSKRIQD